MAEVCDPFCPYYTEHADVVVCAVCGARWRLAIVTYPDPDPRFAPLTEGKWVRA